MNQLETRTESVGEEISTADFMLHESVILAEAIAESLNSELSNARIEVGPADIQVDTTDMTPKNGVNGVIASLKGGLVSRVAMLVDNEVQQLLEASYTERVAEAGVDASPEGGSAWLQSIAEPMEHWARQKHTTMESALPIDNSRQIEHLLLGQGLVLVAVGFFLDGRHVGSVALGGFERSSAGAGTPKVPGSTESTGAGGSDNSAASPAASGRSVDGQAATGDPDSPEFQTGTAEGLTHGAQAETPLVAALHRLADVEMLVTVELGRTRMNVSELLTLGPGSVIELDRAAGSPVDLLVNNTLIARGEVVVVDEEYGVRLTEIFGPAEY